MKLNSLPIRGTLQLRNLHLILLLLFACCLGVPGSRAQTGMPEQSFKFDNGEVNDVIRAVVPLPDGKLLIGGAFTEVRGVARGRIARLNADGTVDLTFDPGTGANEVIQSVVLQPDGKILIGGQFYEFNGVTRRRVARLNPDGSLDETFNADKGQIFYGDVYCIALQSDGKVLIAGSFTGFANVTRQRIARLHADGSIDASFNTTTGSSGTLYTVAVKPDGKVLIGGGFTQYKGVTKRYLAQLNPDGTLDTSFNTEADTAVYAFALQPDGKVIVGGYFNSINDMPRQRLARLNEDGSLDISFQIGTGTSGPIYSVILQADGKVLIGGLFLFYDGNYKYGIARINSDGSLDSSFESGIGATTDAVYSLASQGDGKVFVSGAFTSFNGWGLSDLVRLTNDPATESLSLTETDRIQWLRGGSMPETSEVFFEYSADDGDTWTRLGTGVRISGGWELTGVGLPPGGKIRGRARTGGGFYNGASGFQECVLSYAALPTATTGIATNITRTSADLSGVVNPNGAETTVIFQTRIPPDPYTSEGHVTAEQSPLSAGAEPVDVTATITGLKPGTTYEFNIAAENSEGAALWSESVSFTTLPNTAPVAADRQIPAPTPGSPVTIFDVAQHASDADGDPLTVSIVDGAEAFGVASTDGQTVTFDSYTWTGFATVLLEVSDGFDTVPVAVTMSTENPGTPATVKLAAKGDVVPGAGDDSRIPAGSTWLSFGVPSINDSGEVAYLGNVIGGGRFRGIFAGESTRPQLIVRNKDAAPGTEGAQFTSFRDPLLSNAGEVAFIGMLSGPGVIASNRQGVWKAAPGQSGGYSLELIARTGDAAAGVPDAQWKNFLSVLLNGEPEDSSSRSVVVLASLTGSNVNSRNDLGLWRFDETGAHLLIREGQPLTVRGVTSNVRRFDALSSVAGSPGHGRITAAQGALIRARLEDGRYVILQASDTVPTVLAATADLIEPGLSLAALGIPAGDRSGATQAKVTLKGSGIAAAVRNGLGLFTAEELVGLTFRVGIDGPLAGLPLMKLYRNPVTNSHGESFLAKLFGEGVTKTDDLGIIWQNEGNMTMVARKGAEPDGLPGAQWKSFNSLALPENRGPLFVGTLRADVGGVTRTNDVGLWSADENEPVRAVVREGNTFQGKSLRKFTVLSSVSRSAAQRRSYNSRGEIIYRAYFTDGSQAVMKAELP